MAGIALPGGIPVQPDPYTAMNEGLTRGMGLAMQFSQFQQQKQMNQAKLTALQEEKQLNIDKQNFEKLKLGLEQMGTDKSYGQQKMGLQLIGQTVASSPEIAKNLPEDFDLNKMLSALSPEQEKDIASFMKENIKLVENGEKSGANFKVDLQEKFTEIGASLQSKAFTTHAKVIDALKSPTLGPAFTTESGTRVREKISGTGEILDEVESASDPMLTKSQRGDSESEKLVDHKVKMLMDVNKHLTKAVATGLVLKTMKIYEDPVTKEKFVVDLANDTSTPLRDMALGGQPTQPSTEVDDPSAQPDTSDTEQPAPSAEPKQTTIWGASGSATGPISGALAAGSTVSGIVGGPVATETEQSRQFVKTATSELIRALSINPKFPVSEINRIKEEVNLAPTFFDNPKSFRNRAIAIKDALDIRVKSYIKEAKNPKLTTEKRKAFSDSAAEIKNFFGILGVPKTVNTVEDLMDIGAGEQFIRNGKVFTKKGTE